MDYGGIQARQLGQLKLEDLFNENITSEAMLNNMLGAIALYEVYEDQCEVLRVNQEYYHITGDNPIDMEEHRWFLLNRVYIDDRDWVLSIFEKAYNNPIRGGEGIFRQYRLSGKLMWVHLRVFFLREQDEHRLYYGAVRDATEQMEQRQKLEDSQKILGDMLKLSGRDISFEKLPDRHAAVSMMETYVMRRRFQPSALVLFEILGPGEGCGGGKTVKPLFAPYVECLKRFFREDDIICLNGVYEAMVLCKNIRSNDMEHKLKRVAKALTQELSGNETEHLFSINAAFAIIEAQDKDFEDCRDKARSALVQSRKLTDRGSVK